ncbi:sensor histidine kinase [Pseudomarimonas salicorniae]|uniref:Histidine kinase n=1 Tax=Pseudomarimonas salicorniae TaxID=2933270 RepID=A0ABT0GGA4_9GAMM|nr:histidine kinase [Lysobacter sp. CAU 1642]MCK7593473.1 histidine kinase [Lysobacter sp. CAU 1642]
MSTRWRQITNELLSPLALAAYVAWAVVWLVTIGGMERDGSPWLWPARVAMLVFLAGFLAMVSGLCDSRPGRHLALSLVLGVCALGLTLMRPNSAAAILLVLLAAQMAVYLSGWRLFTAIALVNGLFLGGLFWFWDAGPMAALTTVVAFASFQAFAALMIRSNQTAEQMAEELRAANAELLTSRTLLAAGARDAERLRLSRELHDVAGHSLTALKLNLRALAADPRQSDPERVRLCAGLADELLGSLREVVREMRQDEGLDLGEALARLGLPFPRPALRLDIEPGLKLRGRDRIEAVLRAVQEALTNAARHGPAQELAVHIRPEAGRLQLCIEDDGRAPSEPRAGGGLSGMRERFEALGGEVCLSRSGRGGLRIDAWLPEGEA